jgi:hypothetical protein
MPYEKEDTCHAAKRQLAPPGYLHVCVCQHVCVGSISLSAPPRSPSLPPSLPPSLTSEAISQHHPV